MVEAGMHASRHHPHWKKVFRRLEARIGKHKAWVAVGRKLLISVWHVLTKRQLDRFNVPEKVAATFYAYAYRLGLDNLPDGMSAREYVRHCMDILGVGNNLTHFPWGKKQYSLPPSRLD